MPGVGVRAGPGPSADVFFVVGQGYGDKHFGVVLEVVSGGGGGGMRGEGQAGRRCKAPSWPRPRYRR